MAVYFTAFFLFFFYLAAVPVKFVFIVHIAAQPGFAMGVSAFDSRRAARRANRALSGNSRRIPKLPANSNKKAIFRAAAKMFTRLFRNLRMEKLCLQGRISASDAAATALIYGGAYSLEGALIPLLPPGRVQFHLEPDFTSAASDVMLIGMFSLRAGHIITAALTGAFHYFLQARSMQHGKTSH